MSLDEPIRTDVVVVGAGLAGLTAARLLRDAGRRVLVVDPSEPGGRGRTDRREVPGGAALLNRGPHALYLGGPAERVLGALGVPMHGGPPSATGGALWRGEVHELPTGALALARTSLLTTKGKVAVGRLLARFGRLRTEPLVGVSFGSWLDGLGVPDDARALVEMLGRVATYSHAPSIASAEMVVAQMQAAMGRGVRYLDGGWQSIVDALAAGIELRRATAVAVRGDDTGVEVELADASVVCARAAVVAVGTPAAASGLLGEPFVAGPAVDATCLDLVTSQAAAPGLLLGVDEPLYLSNHCPPAQLAPPGVSVVHVARYLAPDEHPDPHHSRAELMAHAARAGVVPEAVIDQRSLHRMTVVGALATAELGGLRGRPAVDAPSSRRVLLAGDWVGPTGHLLDASIASAEDAARRVERIVAGATLVRR